MMLIEDAVDKAVEIYEGDDVSALLAIQSEVQERLLKLRDVRLKAARELVAQLEGIEGKPGRKRGSKNKPKEAAAQ